MNIVITDGYTENPGDLSWDAFAKYGTLTVFDLTPKELLSARIHDAEIVIANKAVFTKEVLEAAPKLRYIGLLSTGYNTVDLSAAKQLGITVCNIPAYSTDAVAQLVFALLLEICHHVGAHNESVKRGDWSRCPHFCYWDYPLIELTGKTMGIVGFGSIGKRVSRLALAFGMQVLVYTPHPKKEEEQDGLHMVSLPVLLGNSDIVSLHCPLTDSTKDMVDERFLSQMKPGSILINTARGGLIKESDLKKALDSGILSAAGVDVVREEPIREDNPLLSCDNCFITPHIGWAAKETRARLMHIAVDNLASFLSGAPVNCIVKPKEL